MTSYQLWDKHVTAVAVQVASKYSWVLIWALLVHRHLIAQLLKSTERMHYAPLKLQDIALFTVLQLHVSSAVNHTHRQNCTSEADFILPYVWHVEVVFSAQHLIAGSVQKARVAGPQCNTAPAVP